MNLEMGAEAHSSFIKHLKEIRHQTGKEFGHENFFSETEVSRCDDWGGYIHNENIIWYIKVYSHYYFY